MVSKIVLVALCLVVAVAAVPPGLGGFGGFGGFGPVGAGGAGGVNAWWDAPWMPKWSACTGIGAQCLDCTTRIICTKVGGLHRACTDVTLPYCNLGECSATPTAACAPPAAAAPVPATAA